MNNFRFDRYLKITAGMIAIILLAVSVFNRLIDPYALHEGPRFEGINKVKPYFFKQLRMSKAKAVQRLKPAGILLGSSRGEYGLDPLHPGWSADKVYNLSFIGSSIYEVFRYLQHAHAIEPLEEVVLGLSLRQFKYSTQIKEDFLEQRLAVSINGETQNGFVLQDMASANLSLKTLGLSRKTLHRQNEKPYYLQHGERNQERLLDEMKGHRKRFLRAEKGYCERDYRDLSFFNSNGRDSTLSHYRKLLKVAYAESIDLTLLIYPSHARQWEVLAVCGGLWETWEEWKRQLVFINEDEAKWAGKPVFKLWDFSGYSEYSTENVPVAGDNKTNMQWYWESSHFKKELGDIVLDRVFEYSDSGRPVVSDFGVVLSSENIDDHLKQVQIDRLKWRISNPEDVAEILSLRNGK